MKNFLRKLHWEATAIVKVSDRGTVFKEKYEGQSGEEKSKFERYSKCGTNIINQTSGCGGVEVGGVEDDSEVSLG